MSKSKHTKLARNFLVPFLPQIVAGMSKMTVNRNTEQLGSSVHRLS